MMGKMLLATLEMGLAALAGNSSSPQRYGLTEFYCLEES